MFTILIFIGVLLVLVLAHECGHFIMARLFGIRVYEFGFGFPPKIISLVKVHGRWKLRGRNFPADESEGTVYSFNLLPLGGFVRIKGENASEDGAADADSFQSRSFLTKFLVLFAGVAMNVLTAWLLLSGAYLVGLPEMIGPGTTNVYSNRYVQIVEIAPGSPAAGADLKPGDKIITIDGVPITDTAMFRNYVQIQSVRQIILPVTLTLERDGKTRSAAVTPVFDSSVGRAVIGVGIADIGIVKRGVGAAIIAGAKTTGIFLREIFIGLGRLVHSIFGGPSVAGEVAGPVGIAVMTGQAARLGFIYLVQFAAVLSLNLAVLNVLPIPALDGGRIFFLIINALKRRPISPRVEQIVHSVTFALLILLVVIITAKDVVGIIGPLGAWWHKIF